MSETTLRTPCWHLPRGSCAWGVFGTFCHRPTPKVSGCLISAQKAGRTTFVVSFIWLPGQCQNKLDRTPFWHLPRGELCMACIFATFCHQADSKSQRLPISAQKAGRTTFVVSFIWLPGQCQNYLDRTPFWHLPRGSCAWVVFGTFCHQPTPKDSDSPSQPRKQVEQLLWCLSAT